MLTLKLPTAQSLEHLGGLAVGFTPVHNDRNGIRIPFDRLSSEDDGFYD